MSGVPDLHPLTDSIPRKEAQNALHVGRTKLYELLGHGLLDGVKNGPRLEITVESIRRYQAGMPRAKIKAPPPPRLQSLAALHERQREARAKRRAERRSSGRRA